MKRLLFAFILFFSFLSAGLVFAGEEDYEELVSSQAWIDMVSKGKTYLETGYQDEALDYFKNIALMYPYIPESQYYLGYVYFKMKDHDNAEKVFGRALKLDPGFIPALYYLAVIKHEKGDEKASVKLLDEVTAIDPSFQSAYFNKGVAYMKMGVTSSAIREFAYAVYLEPTDENSINALFQAYAMERQAKVPVQPGVIASEGDRGLGEARKNAGTPQVAGTAADNMEIYAVNPGEKREKLPLDAMSAELVTKGGKKAFLEVVFPGGSADLGKKTVKFKAKGGVGGEKIKVTIKDSLTRSTPGSYLDGVSADWKEFNINAGQDAYLYVDIYKVSKVTIELVPAGEAEERVYLKEMVIE